MAVKFNTLWAALILVIGLGTPALGEVAKVNTNESGIAIEGYDPVAYFEESKPMKGLTKFRATHEGATFQFASSHHMTLFKKDPAKYIPAYGGYCAFGMRYGQVSRIDPHAWEIVDGKLYLALNHGTRAIWQKKKDENITIANKLWGKLTTTQ